MVNYSAGPQMIPLEPLTQSPSTQLPQPNHQLDHQQSLQQQRNNPILSTPPITAAVPVVNDQLHTPQTYFKMTLENSERDTTNAGLTQPALYQNHYHHDNRFDTTDALLNDMGEFDLPSQSNTKVMQPNPSLPITKKNSFANNHIDENDNHDDDIGLCRSPIKNIDQFNPPGSKSGNNFGNESFDLQHNSLFFSSSTSLQNNTNQPFVTSTQKKFQQSLYQDGMDEYVTTTNEFFDSASEFNTGKPYGRPPPTQPIIQRQTMNSSGFLDQGFDVRKDYFQGSGGLPGLMLASTSLHTSRGVVHNSFQWKCCG